MKKIGTYALVCSFLVIFLAFNVHATTIQTPRNGGYGIFSTIYTYGQTFSLDAGDDTVLDTIELYVNWSSSSPNPGTSAVFSLSVYEWDDTASSPTGALLGKSSVYSTSTAFPSYEAITVDMGGISLSTGTDYIWHLTLADITGKGNIGADTTGSYANGGAFNYSYGSWSDQYFIGKDLAFTMTLSAGGPQPVPEPTTISLLGLAIFGMIGIHRKNKS